MCGIAGFWGGAEHDSQPALLAMTRAIRHRGPDDEGLWRDEDAGIGLGHRRLSIVDLSAQGHQPMVSACGRYVVTYNGEIYNHAEIRAEIERESATPPGWRGHSDTEVMLAAISRWGLEGAIRRFAGMFAFALWDRAERNLYLARDRMGEKPLYYGWCRGAFLFGSELKALRAHPAWSGEVDRNVLMLLLRHGYIPAPYSIYCNVRKLIPGTIVKVHHDSRGGPGREEVTRYWDPAAVAAAACANPFAGTDDEALASLEQLVRQSVRLQMVADVPLGAFLSGGIDSSTVVALMQASSPGRVKTFTIGFDESGYDEAGFAAQVARHLGTEHTELYLGPRDALNVIPRLPTLYDEPFADSSQIPTYLVSELARRHVTVSLSGDGGDELFGGYTRYALGERVWNRISRVPPPVRRMAAAAIGMVSPRGWDRAIDPVAALFGSNAPFPVSGHRLHRLKAALASDRFEEMYRALVSQWQRPEAVVPGASEPVTVLTDVDAGTAMPDTLGRMMYLDAVSYLPDDILVKLDRASMGVALESRVPFLDHRIVEFAWSLPRRMRLRDGKGKWILRQLLGRYVPAALFERPKMGFGVPIDVWLRGPLREWAEAMLSERRLAGEGFFDPPGIRQKWAEHLSGKYDRQHFLWSVLVFQAWLESQ